MSSSGHRIAYDVLVFSLSACGAGAGSATHLDGTWHLDLSRTH